ncbi:SPOR domain-containing protein [Pseudomonas sp. N040]|uniref:SPOR domain-containing protein n=1 Tax=Pseudomonas sp. N040 TaxID=2785325 RepID=UPI0018A2C3BF|nr:AAA family ATPase [Pseudomonas sp. N040]MBF7729880.1 SPOR domain-containing protein [Pseudomonas sp. N040]MBW7013522.1 SPOR domain-containing protein [Pseudomonas sp. N040]
MTSLHADEALLGYYQFSHDPFTPRVPGFKFYPAQRKSVLGQLHHLARYGQQLLLVAGPKGSGKTLLRQALVASTNKQSVHSIVLSGRESGASAAVLKLVASGVGASSPAVDAILSRAGQLAVTGQEVYLLVDDAGRLDDQALRVLIALAAGNGAGRLHVFLFAEAELAPRLGLLAEDPASVHCVELQPYTDAETREYLALRLEGAGQSLELLTDEQIESIHAESEGWPGAINQVARDTMIEAMLADRGAQGARGFSFGLPKKHVLALVIAAAVVGGAWLMNSNTGPVPGEVLVPATAGSGQAGAEVPSRAPTVEFSSSASATPQVVQPIIREPLAQASGNAEGEDAAGAQEVLAPAETVAGPVVVAAESPGALVPLPLPNSQAPAQVAPPVSASGAPGSAAAQVPPVTAAVEVASAAAPVASATALPVVQDQPKPKPPAVTASASAGSQWYRAQEASRVTLQILGTRSEASAKSFVKQNGGDYHYFMKLHQGAPMYVVTYGVFSGRDAAQAAVQTLPAKIQAGKPWPKTFASIQQEMSAGR